MRRTPPRRYWLTGVSNGIGAALAEEILKTGAHLAVSSRSLAPLKALSQRYPGQVLVVAGDLTNGQRVREIGEQIAKEWGSLDTMILNAGTCEYVDANQFDSSIIEHIVRTNLLASSYCIAAARPLLQAGTAPHLVGMASSVTWLPLPRAESHGDSKAGLRHLFESLRIDVAPENIEMTVVSPGLIDTPLSNNAQGHLDWSAGKAARYLFDMLKNRPLDLPLPELLMPVLWPLSQKPDRTGPTIGERARCNPPLEDLP
ncbi:SDR family oxidoreductase [Pseudomonas frederiksbergensis]|uniref:SDR family NAD(P)-dependent oxidoreductase n=1 Tax=Pseudomonas frederiksbergensis TaxID=104087 RepID=UPI00197EADA6|nr:SDR family oxidoreductase [Pseudomonas frederiksbergensis]MBN3864118.1 SDR family oxidoreductase [Pseudomonas frederiksbergensis]